MRITTCNQQLHFLWVTDDGIFPTFFCFVNSISCFGNLNASIYQILNLYIKNLITLKMYIVHKLIIVLRIYLNKHFEEKLFLKNKKV